MRPERARAAPDAPDAPTGPNAPPRALCLVPARGGSKRIPGKNARAFCGVPMIRRSIEAALGAGCFARVVVSTDDRRLAELAREAGAEVPFVRPAPLSDDHATTLEVVRHALDALELGGPLPARVCCLYATAPFVRAGDLVAGAAALDGADFAMAVARYAFPIQRAVRVDASGALRMVDPARYAARSQDLEETLHDAGQFYWGTVDAWRDERPFFDSRVAPIELPRWRVRDIDTPEDWTEAEALFRALGG